MKTIKAALGIGVRRASQRKQSGVATILVILMVGVGLVAVSVGTMHTMRNTQERQLVAHSQVNAQAGAWAAVEAVRQMLGTLTADQLAGLVKNNEWSISGTGVDGLTQKAVVTDIIAPAALETDYKIKAQVSAVAAAGQSSSTVEVVYSVVAGSAPSPFVLNGVLDFYNDLKVEGGMTFNAPTDSTAAGPNGLNFNVDGNMKLNSVGISGDGIHTLKVTGNLEAGSNVNAQVVYARNIKITGAANIVQAYAFGDPAGKGSETSIADGDTCCGAVNMSGGTGITILGANGWVTSGGGGVTNINARRHVKITQWGSYSEIISGEYIDAEIGGTVTTAKAVGNVILKETTTTSVLSLGNIECKSSSKDHPLLRANGTITGCKEIKSPLNLKPGQSLTASDIGVRDVISPVTLTRPTVDAWALKGAANYAIERVATGGYKVEVKSINGVTDGTYYLKATSAWKQKNSSGTEVTVDTGEREFLCPLAEGTLATAALCAHPVKPFCNGFSSNGSCFKDSTATLLKVNGKSLPPGVIWIKGDFEMGSGIYYNTFISTGNISTSGAAVSYSVNYASAYKNTPSNTSETAKNAICKNEFKEVVADFKDMYPTNYCDSTGKYTPNAVGNIGLLAGGYATEGGTKTYLGGNISLNNSNTIFGTVVAGNLLKTSGQTVIHGYVSAAGSQLSEGENVTGNSTTIDLKYLPPGYKPGEIPNMGGGSTGAVAKSEVLWSRYL